MRNGHSEDSVRFAAGNAAPVLHSSSAQNLACGQGRLRRFTVIAKRKNCCNNDIPHKISPKIVDLHKTGPQKQILTGHFYSMLVKI